MAQKISKDKSFTSQTKTYKEIADTLLKAKMQRANWLARLILKRFNK